MDIIQKQRGWLSLKEAVSYIGKQLDVTVGVDDLLHLAADGELKLSARFATRDVAGVWIGTIITPEESDLDPEVYGEKVEFDASPWLGGLNGVFDLKQDGLSAVWVTPAGEVESQLFSLEFYTDDPSRILSLNTRTLPSGAQWVLRAEHVLEYCQQRQKVESFTVDVEPHRPPAPAWAIQPPKNERGYNGAVLRGLQHFHEAGHPRPPKPFELLEHWRGAKDQYPEFKDVFKDSVSYQGSDGEFRIADLEAIRKAIKRQIVT